MRRTTRLGVNGGIPWCACRLLHSADHAGQPDRAETEKDKYGKSPSDAERLAPPGGDLLRLADDIAVIERRGRRFH
ncbi:hypothetical protein [Amycolatopsis sp. NPDC059657]|uniref:hypothetical protein n=1 Tax=Amycolatopsis sp. NPDC059657 TaxID=3346899 RepID=UPI00366C4317